MRVPAVSVTPVRAPAWHPQYPVVSGLLGRLRQCAPVQRMAASLLTEARGMDNLMLRWHHAQAGHSLRNVLYGLFLRQQRRLRQLGHRLQQTSCTPRGRSALRDLRAIFSNMERVAGNAVRMLK